MRVRYSYQRSIEDSALFKSTERPSFAQQAPVRLRSAFEGWSIDVRSSKDARGDSVVTPREFLCTVSSGTRMDGLEPSASIENGAEMGNERNAKSSWGMLEANLHGRFRGYRSRSLEGANLGI